VTWVCDTILVKPLKHHWYLSSPVTQSIIVRFTALDAAADDHAFSNILSDASRVLLNVTYTLPPTAPVSDDAEPTDSSVVLSALKFYTGRRRGQSCSYNGYLYTHNKFRPTGHSYWDCKDRRSYNPHCKGRLSTLGGTVTKENPHCHPETELKILQTATGMEATRKPRNKTLKIKERVKKTVQGYNSGNIIAYCRSLGHLSS
jgi:hypothetical protein